MMLCLRCDVTQQKELTVVNLLKLFPKTKQRRLTGDVGEVHRAGHRQEEEERQLHGGLLLLRLSAPEAFSYSRLISWTGLHAKMVPISRTRWYARKQALGCALTKRKDPRVRTRVAVSLHCDSGRGAAVNGEALSGSRKGGEGKGREGRGGEDSRVGLRSESLNLSFIFQHCGVVELI